MSSESVKARLEAATPGQWRADEGACCVGTDEADIAEGIGRHPYAARGDADLIAHAPTDLAAALKVIEAAQRVSTFLVESPYYQGEKIDGAFDLERVLAEFEALP